MAFAKLKTPIRKAAARTEDSLRQAVSDVCDPFTADECHNDFKAAGYEANQTRYALKRSAELLRSVTMAPARSAISVPAAISHSQA